MAFNQNMSIERNEVKYFYAMKLMAKIKYIRLKLGPSLIIIKIYPTRLQSLIEMHDQLGPQEA